MKKISHLLSAVDFSDPAVIALDRAGLLARERQARLLVFHMMTESLFQSWPRGFDPLLSNISSNLESEIEQRLEALADRQKKLGSKRVRTILAEDDGMNILVDTIKKNKIDLVVAGAHGTGYWHELFLGSFITKLIAHNPVPTLVVKEQKLASYKKLLVPIDFSALTASPIEAAQAIAPDAQKILLHVVHTPHEGLMRLKKANKEQIEQYRQACFEEAKKKLDDLVSSTQDSTFTSAIIELGYAPAQIISYQRENSCDLVVIGKHGTGYLSDLLVGSVTNLVMTNTSCDTLITVGHRG